MKSSTATTTAKRRMPPEPPEGCHLCRARGTMAAAEFTQTVTLADGTRASGVVPGFRCVRCGEQVVEAADLLALEEALELDAAAATKGGPAR